jgi:hypothetical protein
MSSIKTSGLSRTASLILTINQRYNLPSILQLLNSCNSCFLIYESIQP